MRLATYETWEERQQLCKDANAAGEVMLHDEVRDGMNTLIFEIAPPDPSPPPVNPHLARLKELMVIENEGPISDVELLELVRLEREHRRFIASL
jgi:hypothetical protein